VLGQRRCQRRRFDPCQPLPVWPNERIIAAPSACRILAPSIASKRTRAEDRRETFREQYLVGSVGDEAAFGDDLTISVHGGQLIWRRQLDDDPL
jgi:hypothetical protein